MPVFPWWDVSAHRFWKQSKLLQKHLAFRYTDFREINLGHYTSGPRPMVLVDISLRRSLAGHAFRQATDDHRYIYAYAGVFRPTGNESMQRVKLKGSTPRLTISGVLSI
ncbi:uncharacterized protein H6S33_003285 [Morchella sextelata]|uniref:uncharacterized protein n=1 Tax=Morchella sextelata TaxID=1174677 RepID=UPI001D036183|nr:uncharacterized protein H6S33_003285 [Morchella sextelata]KAH0607297.1 hypothetical protein H6S33_003285 [Morchella sextelata]